MKIAIVGAGWFGCHLASELLAAGFEVSVYEARPEIFGGASSHNQNRLHLGFHYPRSFVTRQQSIEGFSKFQEFYPQFSVEVPHNIYAVANNDSLIDYETYLQILTATGLDYDLCDPQEYGLENVGGAIKCDERLIETTAACRFFSEHLQDQLCLNTPVTHVENSASDVMVNGDRYDFLVNCTYQAFLPSRHWEVTYEPCVTMMYQGDPDEAAITMMDGPFFTIYPFENGYFSVYSVVDTPLGRFKNYRNAERRLIGVSNNEVRELRGNLEKLITGYYPSFHDRFKFSHTSSTVRMKVTCRSDARYCEAIQEDRVIQVLSGKIDMIFTAAEKVLALINGSKLDQDYAVDTAELVVIPAAVSNRLTAPTKEI